MSLMRDDELCVLLELDLLPHIDLVDFYRGKVSLRRLSAAASRLPRTSRVWQELAARDNGGHIPWSQLEYLVAADANANRQIAYLLTFFRWIDTKKKGPEPEFPEPILPPGYQPHTLKMTPMEDVMAVLAVRIG